MNVYSSPASIYQLQDLAKALFGDLSFDRLKVTLRKMAKKDTVTKTKACHELLGKLK